MQALTYETLILVYLLMIKQENHGEHLHALMHEQFGKAILYLKDLAYVSIEFKRYGECQTVEVLEPLNLPKGGENECLRRHGIG